MKFEVDITEHEAKDGLGLPPVTGTYLLVVVEFLEFTANSGTQGANVNCRIVGTDKPDTKRYHGSFARPTFFMTEKTIGNLRGWLDKINVKYDKNGMNEADTIGKVFWGRLRCYTDENGYDKQDLLRWETASDAAKAVAQPFVLEWTGEDKVPDGVGPGVSVGKKKPTTSPENPAKSVDTEKVDGGFIDDDLPF